MTDYITTTETAALVRKALKIKFPGVKFSVRSERYAGGSTVRVNWIDGPTQAQVETITKPFCGGRFDGMIDMAYSVDSWLLPDGTAMFGRSPGTHDNGGSDPAYDVVSLTPGARKVRFGISHLFCSREISAEYEAKAALAWAALSGEEQCKLLNSYEFPRWPEERPGRRLASFLAA